MAEPGSDQADDPEAPSHDRYSLRRDVSAVKPQGGYAAKRCPLWVQYDALPPPGVDPLPHAAFARSQMDAGNDFEIAIFLALEAFGDVVHLDDSLPEPSREAATLGAMANGSRVILGGRLPLDVAGRRVGKPDVLVRAEVRPDGRWAYVPVDVKHHAAFKAKADASTMESSLETPAWSDATARIGWILGDHKKSDGFQLAHYVRMLEACGHDSTCGMGGISGKERVISWIDLTDPSVLQTWRRGHADKESLLQRYDFEFAFRLDVIAAASADEPIVEPVLNSDCPACPWRGACLPELEARDCVSLLPGVTYREWYVHRQHAITTRRQLAALDYDAARLRDAYKSGDLGSLVESARSVPPETLIEDLVGRRSKVKIATLNEHGVVSAGDLIALPDDVVATSGRPVGRLADSIDKARVATVGGGRPHLRRGTEQVIVPSADVEVDIDMENTLDGSYYLWGALLDGEYHPFVSWEQMTPRAEAMVFDAFWEWLTSVRSTARDAGKTVAVYCWSQKAEIGALEAGAQLAVEELGHEHAPAEVAEFIASGELVDLLQVFNEQVETAGSSGLKRIAPMAGFDWRDEDPGGATSMLWHAEAIAATDEPVRSDLQERLLAYNEDDVRATAAIRSWLRVADLPRVTDIDPTTS